MSTGLRGTLRLLGMLAVLSLAALAVLFVLDVIPREELAGTASKVGLLLGIGAIAALALGALLKSRD